VTKRTFELVLFGATGFTGKQTLLHLVKHVPRGFKWAIAGRNQEKLEALLPLCEAAASTPAIVLCDANDEKSADKLVASTAVIIQLAGPYGKTGETFVASAAQHGAHYLDLSGEIAWVAEMISRHHETAKASKSKIIPVCGFEALPFDIAALLIAEKLKARTGERATSIELINRFTGPPAFRPRDILSGGTMASIKAMLEEGTSASLSDPAVLVDDAKIAAHIRTNYAYDFRARYSNDAGAWLAPTLPAPFVNPPVVYRTMALFASSKSSPFAAGCGYVEAMSTQSFVPFAIGQRIVAEMLSRSFSAVALSVARNGRIDQIGRTAVKTLFDWIGPISGQGPSEKHLSEAGYTLHMRASNASGKSVVAHANASGHPGYRSTAMLVAEAGLLLAGAGAEGCGALPRRAGVLTPASAFGVAAMPAWARAGLVFDV
jgi:short subunit dehydrogenase-like uncharacterized protein